MASALIEPAVLKEIKILVGLLRGCCGTLSVAAAQYRKVDETVSAISWFI